MIDLKKDDILTADVEALVNTVSAWALWGAVLRFSSARPFRRTSRSIRPFASGGLKPGRMFVHEQGQLANPRYIINFPTRTIGRAKAGLSTSMRDWRR